jgi:hypothetical protein
LIRLEGSFDDWAYLAAEAELLDLFNSLPDDGKDYAIAYAVLTEKYHGEDIATTEFERFVRWVDRYGVPIVNGNCLVFSRPECEDYYCVEPSHQRLKAEGDWRE